MARSVKLSEKRKERVRYNLRANNKTNRPRLSVFVSNNHIYAQIIDDQNAVTLVSASTRAKDFVPGESKKTNNVAAATQIGSLIATKASEKGIKDVVFDKGERLYHGKVKALADAAREKLNF